MDTRISLIVTTSDEATIVKVTEHLARTATGLALDGVSTALFIGPDFDLDDDGNPIEPPS